MYIGNRRGRRAGGTKDEGLRDLDMEIVRSKSYFKRSRWHVRGRAVRMHWIPNGRRVGDYRWQVFGLHLIQTLHRRSVGGLHLSIFRRRTSTFQWHGHIHTIELPGSKHELIGGLHLTIADAVFPGSARTQVLPWLSALMA
jgi:hypothetical protein